MGLPVVFLVIAVVLFGLGAWSRWWVSPAPYYPTFVCGGPFFLGALRALADVAGMKTPGLTFRQVIEQIIRKCGRK